MIRRSSLIVSLWCLFFVSVASAQDMATMYAQAFQLDAELKSREGKKEAALEALGKAKELAPESDRIQQADAFIQAAA